jgi:hypothetical protein
MTKKPNAEPSGPSNEPAKKRRSFRAGKVIAILLVLLIIATAAATFPLWRDRAGFPAPRGGVEIAQLRAELATATDRLTQLEATLSQSGDSGMLGRLAAAEQKVSALETQPQVPSHVATEVETLTRQVAELKRNAVDPDTLTRLPGEVEALGHQVADLKKTAADAATMLRLFDRVDQAEASLRELQSRHASAAALLLAVGQLREVVNLGQPFDPELRAVKALGGDDPDVVAPLEMIRALAETGIPTRAVLASGFEQLAPKVVRAEMLPEEQGWSRRAADRMLSLVSIRREPGVVAGNDATAIVARAEAALDGGDLAGATTEVSLLVYAPGEAAAEWLAGAKARLAADKALADLSAHAIAQAGARP